MARADPARGAFLAIVIEDVRDRRFLGRVQQIRSRGAVIAHPHVQGPVAQEREPAIRLVQLHRADAKVQHHAVQRLPGQIVHVRERPLDQPQPVAIFAAPAFGHAEDRRIAVHADHDIGARRQQAAAVAARAEGAVQPDARNRVDRAQQGIEKYGDMRICQWSALFISAEEDARVEFRSVTFGELLQRLDILGTGIGQVDLNIVAT